MARKSVVATVLALFMCAGLEAEQVCSARGGHLCTTVEWQGGCVTNPPSGTNCSFGYAPRGGACASAATSGAKFCNLGSTYDFDASRAGDQDGLLVTGSASLKSCYADWSGLYSATNDKLFDVTGNLRELTRAAVNSYVLMGGSYLTQSESGSACGFTFNAVDQNYRMADTGFRCCYASDPTL